MIITFFYDVERGQFAYDKGAEILYFKIDKFLFDPKEENPYYTKDYENECEKFRKNIISSDGISVHRWIWGVCGWWRNVFVRDVTGRVNFR